MLPKVNLFSTYYFSEVLSGIGIAAKQRGYDRLLLFREPDEPRDYANLFRTQKVDACIVLGAQDIPKENGQRSLSFRKASYPFCLVNQRFDGGSASTSRRCRSPKWGACQAVKHLIDGGASHGFFSRMDLRIFQVISDCYGRLHTQAWRNAGLTYRPSMMLVGQLQS